MNFKPPHTPNKLLFDNYVNSFVQRWPRYAIKHIDGKKWKTKKKNYLIFQFFHILRVNTM